MITSSGPLCDVCDNYIFWGKVHCFTLPLFEDALHACDTCVRNWPSFVGDWRKLPDKGRLRAAYEKEFDRSVEELEELKSQQEELEEGGDLEDRLEIAMKIADLEERIYPKY